MRMKLKLALIVFIGFAMASCGDDAGRDCDLHGYHVWGEWVATSPATCEEEGVDTRRCIHCNASDTRRAIALGHDLYEEVTTPATCRFGGMYRITCQREGCDYSGTGFIWPLGCDWEDEWELVLPPTNTERGRYDRGCLRDGCEHIDSRDIPALLSGWCGCGLECCNDFDDCHELGCSDPDVCTPILCPT